MERKSRLSLPVSSVLTYCHPGAEVYSSVVLIGRGASPELAQLKCSNYFGSSDNTFMEFDFGI